MKADIWDTFPDRKKTKPEETKPAGPIPPKEPTDKAIADTAEKPNIVIKKKEKRQFFLTQTLTKEINNHYGEKKEVCARKIRGIYITGEYKKPKTPPMNEGHFFETLCLGSGRGGKRVTELPKHKRTGKKLINQERLEMQAARFPILCEKHMINVIPGVNTQVPITRKLKDGIYCRTEMDIFPTTITVFNEETGKWVLSPAVIDLKATGDITNTHGDWCWGSPSFIDHAQGDMTHWLIREFDYELNAQMNPEFEERIGYKNVFTDFIQQVIKEDMVRFFYMVFGYKVADLTDQFRLFERTYRDPGNNNNNRPKEWIERMKSTIRELHYMKEANWPFNASEELCKNCPLSSENGGDCNDYNKITQV